MSKLPTIKLYHFLSLLFTAALILAFFRIHSRIQITLLGYEIGRMKELEEKLLKKRSQLTMELAKITTRDHLLALSEKERPKAPQQRHPEAPQHRYPEATQHRHPEATQHRHPEAKPKDLKAATN